MPERSLTSPIYRASTLHGTAPHGRTLFLLPTLSFTPGVTWLLGDEGSGKTTLLQILAGNLPRSVGNAVLAGYDLHTSAQNYQQEVAWLDPVRSTWEQTVVNEFWKKLAQGYAHWSQETLEDLADALDLQAHRTKPLYMLSAGSRRKALMAAAFASGAKLTLLDMPFAALDAAACRTLREVLADCADHPHRAFVVADYTAPAGVPAPQVLNLDAISPA